MVKFFIFAMLMGFIACFQNCAGKDFSLRTDLNKATSLDGTEMLVSDDTVNPDSELDGVINNGGGSSAPTNGGGSSGGSKDDSDTSDDGSVADNDDKDDDLDDDAEVGEVDKDGKICMRHGVKMKTTDVGVCILEGNGKSQRVALTNDQIVSNNSTPKTVCMTALACRKIIDEKFKVVTLEKRGFCKNGSADSVLLTDEQVRTLIDQIK